jgi:Flp pilus assembly protein TadG
VAEGEGPLPAVLEAKDREVPVMRAGITPHAADQGVRVVRRGAESREGDLHLAATNEAIDNNFDCRVAASGVAEMTVEAVTWRTAVANVTLRRPAAETLDTTPLLIL